MKTFGSGELSALQEQLDWCTVLSTVFKNRKTCIIIIIIIIIIINQVPLIRWAAIYQMPRSTKTR